MVRLPPPEETAQKILGTFVSYLRSRPGDVVKARSLRAAWAGQLLDGEDFVPGMKYAVEKGWVEVLRGGELFRLTDAGFVAA